LLGAAGLGDLGEVYPDTEPTLEGADSVVLLRGVAEMVTKAGWTIGNADCSVVCESPKLAPRRAEMEHLLGEAIGAQVSVKGRRAEGIGAIGRGEGVVCFAVVVVSRGAS
jgi:2-C-methyl-D-erythritol 2,4-cyclodiphosphate synthase